MANRSSSTAPGGIRRSVLTPSCSRRKRFSAVVELVCVSKHRHGRRQNTDPSAGQLRRDPGNRGIAGAPTERLGQPRTRWRPPGSLEHYFQRAYAVWRRAIYAPGVHTSARF